MKKKILALFLSLAMLLSLAACGGNNDKSDIWHWGVRCYRSKDLYNWTDCGLIIPPEP